MIDANGPAPMDDIEQADFNAWVMALYSLLIILFALFFALIGAGSGALYFMAGTSLLGLVMAVGWHLRARHLRKLRSERGRSRSPR